MGDSKTFEHKEQIREIERVFEEAMKRVENNDSEDYVIPSDVRKQMIEKQHSTISGTVPYSGKYSRCMAFFRTICASLATKQVKDVSEAEVEVIREVYLFITGPFREFANRIDPSSGLTVSDIDAERVLTELSRLANKVKSENILNKEHTH